MDDCDGAPADVRTLTSRCCCFAVTQQGATVCASARAFLRACVLACVRLHACLLACVRFRACVRLRAGRPAGITAGKRRLLIGVHLELPAADGGSVSHRQRQPSATLV